MIKIAYDFKVIRKLRASNRASELLEQACPGGACYINLLKNETIFSENLVTIFALRPQQTSLEHIIERFEEGKHMMKKAVESLKRQEHAHMTLPALVNVAGEKKSIQCYGHVVQGKEAKPVAMIWWFFDVTAYVDKASALSQKNRELQQQHRMLSQGVEQFPLPIWRRGSDGEIVYANKAYLTIVGYESGPLPELDRVFAYDAQMALKERRHIHLQKHLIDQGKRKLFELHEYPTSAGMVGYGQDISNLETLKEDLGRHISAHSDFLESSSSAISIYGKDRLLQFYNRAFVSLWGLEESFLDSSPSYSEVLEILREERRLPEQADFKSFRDSQLALFNELVSPQNEFYHLPNGKTIRVIVIPHALGGIMFVYEDMTDRLVMERSYNTLIAVQQETLDHLNDAIVVIGENGRMTLYNPRFLELWPAIAEIADSQPHVSDLMEYSRSLFFYGRGWERFKERVISQLERRKETLQRMERDDGKVLDIRIVPLPDGATLVSFIDVTDSIVAEKNLREKNQALLQADKLKTEFLMNVSHELRMPLTSIMGFSEALQRELIGKLNARQKEYSHDIYTASNHLMVLIDSILDLASIESGEKALQQAPFDICQSLYVWCEEMRDKYQSIDCELLLECDEALGDVYADEARMKQVVLFVFIHLLKYNRVKGHITVRAVPVNRNVVRIEIEDQGFQRAVGAVASDIAPILQDNAIVSQDKASLGLAISIARNIVELHSSEMDITPKTDGGMKVSWPLSRSDEERL